MCSVWISMPNICRTSPVTAQISWSPMLATRTNGASLRRRRRDATPSSTPRGSSSPVTFSMSPSRTGGGCSPSTPSRCSSCASRSGRRCLAARDRQPLVELGEVRHHYGGRRVRRHEDDDPVDHPIVRLPARQQGVRVNAVCPGVIDTPMQDKVLAEVAPRRGLTVEQMSAARNAAVPLGRPGTPAETAALIWFLCSPSRRT